MKSPRQYSTSIPDLILSTAAEAVILAACSAFDSSFLSPLAVVAQGIIMGYMIYSLIQPSLEVGTSVDEATYNRKMRIVDTPKYRHPSGWYYVCDSGDIPVGGIKPFTIASTEIMVFRGENGKAAIMDPFCPHKGASIPHGGKVVGNCAVCPFHEWPINQLGDIEDIPYSKTKVCEKLRVWHSIERFGCLFVWFDAGQKEPFYDLPLESEHKIPPGFKYAGRIVHTLSCAEWEIHDNSADFIHFEYLHKEGGAMGDNKWKNYSWDVIDETSAKGNISGDFDFCGIHLPISVEWKNYWFGLILITGKAFGGYGDTYILDYTTPIDYHKSKREILMFLPWFMPKFISDLIVRRLFYITMQDVIVWNHKKPLDKPIVLAEEKLMVAFNRWKRKLYTAGI